MNTVVEKKRCYCCNTPKEIHSYTAAEWRRKKGSRRCIQCARGANANRRRIGGVPGKPWGHFEI